MTLTLTPSRLASCDSALEKLPIAALTDAPIEKSAPGERAAPPPILTTKPCAAFSIGQNSRHIRTQPNSFSAYPSIHASSGRSTKLPALVAPAEHTTMSQRLNFAFTA